MEFAVQKETVWAKPDSKATAPTVLRLTARIRLWSQHQNRNWWPDQKEQGSAGGAQVRSADIDQSHLHRIGDLETAGETRIATAAPNKDFESSQLHGPGTGIGVPYRHSPVI